MKQTSLTLATTAILIITIDAATAISYCPPTPPNGGANTDCHGKTTLDKSSGRYFVTDICGLETIPGNAHASYVIKQNIDATCTSELGWGNVGFTPVPDTFDGTIDGRGHWINGLTIRGGYNNSEPVGLFSSIGTDAKIVNLALTNANVSGFTNNASVGILAGISSGTVSFIYATGEADGGGTYTGGIVGENSGKIVSSFAGVTVGGYDIGGIAGGNDLSGIIQNSYVTAGAVSGNFPGGLVGLNDGVIEDSSSSVLVYSGYSPPMGDPGPFVGGLVGQLNGYVLNSYASGSVIVRPIYASHYSGGLIGTSADTAHVTNSYSVGFVSPNGGGGMVGEPLSSSGGTYVDAYWDVNTSQMASSWFGIPRATAHLQGNPPPAGLNSYPWLNIVPWNYNNQNISYPLDIAYSCAWGGSFATDCTSPKKLLDPDCTDTDSYFCSVLRPMTETFEPRLATLIASPRRFGSSAGIFVIPPIGQKQLFQYTDYSNAEVPTIGSDGKQYPAAALACKGTVYAMIARLIGTIFGQNVLIQPNRGLTNICGLSDVAETAHVDCLLISTPKAKEGLAFWPTSLNSYAKLSAELYADYARIDDTQIVSKVLSSAPVIIHGMTSNGFDHVMLVTSIVTDANGNATRLVANDPEIGQQVFIVTYPTSDPAYHHAVLNPTGTGSPASYIQLSKFDFTADSYAYVNWQQPAPQPPQLVIRPGR